MVPQEQQPVMRDFLGLGNLEPGDGGPPAADREAPVPCLGRSVNIEHPAGMKNRVYGIGLSSDEGHGLAYTWQWPFPRAFNAPQMRSSLLGEAHAKSSSGPQLTIFYAGNVNVYNNISVNTAEAIMQMASTGNTVSSTAFLDVGLDVQQVVHQHSSVGENISLNAQIGQSHFVVDQGNQNCPHSKCECVTPSMPSSASSPQPMVPRALPLARKASLARFLEKRKERMRMMAPYFKKQQAQAVFPCPGETVITFNHGAALTRVYKDLSNKSIFSAMPESLAVRGDMPDWGYFVKD